MHPLIDVAELQRRLEEVKVFDLRWSLTDPRYGRSQYQEGHIPGAVFVDLDTDLSAPVGEGRHPLPSPAVFTGTLGRLGIEPDDEVVVYDDMAGAVAGRMWWMLRAIGHTAGRLLDGGLHAWNAAGLSLETGDVLPIARSYTPVHGFSGVVRFDELDDRVVVDVRAPERYTGETEPVDPKAGHIPGAINIPLARSLDENRKFLGSDRLQALYSGIGDIPVISCGSGVNACHTALAMVLAGRDMPDVYIGSFSDWSRRDLPIAQGLDP